MTPEEIKSEVELCYESIKSANERLVLLRSKCKHEDTFEGNYSWRIGSVFLANICSYCGQVVSNVGDELYYKAQAASNKDV